MTASEPVSMPMAALARRTAMFATKSPASTRRTARDRSRALSAADMVCKLVMGADLVNAGQDGRSMLRPYLTIFRYWYKYLDHGRFAVPSLRRPHPAQDP